MEKSNSIVLDRPNINRTSTTTAKKEFPVYNSKLEWDKPLGFSWEYSLVAEPMIPVIVPETKTQVYVVAQLLSIQEKKQILEDFVHKIVNNSEDIEPKISRLVTKNFADLLIYGA